MKHESTVDTVGQTFITLKNFLGVNYMSSKDVLKELKEAIVTSLKSYILI